MMRMNKEDHEEDDDESDDVWIFLCEKRRY